MGLNYLSPTSISTWQQSKENFYMKYLAKNRVPREPQTMPMAIGSAFDSMVKSDLGGYNFEEMFEQSVEPHNRGPALAKGREVFNFYTTTPQYGYLKGMIEKAELVRMEGMLIKEVDGVPLGGKPDALIRMPGGYSFVLDWKVNGWMSLNKPSINKGFVTAFPQPPRARGPALIGNEGGVEYNMEQTLDMVNRDWAQQVCIYFHLFGEGTVGWIEQLVPYRVGSYRGKIQSSFKQKVIDQAKEIWQAIHDGWIFKEVSLEESQARCYALDQAHTAYRDTGFIDLISS